MRKAILTERAVPVMLALQGLDPSWTLGLPPFRQFGQTEHESWSAMFDLERIGNLLPGSQMVEATDYFAWRPTVDFVLFLGDNCPPGIEDREEFPHKLFGLDVTVSKCKCVKTLMEAGYRPDASSPGSFAGLIDKLAAGAAAGAPKVVFATNFEDVLPEHAFDKEGIALKVERRGHVRFNRKVRATHAIRVVAGGGEGENECNRQVEAYFGQLSSNSRPPVYCLSAASCAVTTTAAWLTACTACRCSTPPRRSTRRPWAAAST